MLVEIEINDDDILYAENILFKGRNIHFDHERKDFIKEIKLNFDLQAVPWSWKTTALLAKLLILEKYIDRLEWWILVLSHTNVAINHIKEKIEKYCPKLFWWYPHFVWTIQSFVDDFLAKPYYSKYHKKKLSSIDDDFFFKVMYKEYKFIEWSDLNWKKIGNTFHKIRRSTQGNVEERIKEELKTIHYDEDDNKIKDWKWNTLAGDPAMVKIRKENIFNKLNDVWIIRYNEAFLLWKKYLSENSLVRYLLKKRFKYIFIDETQDLEKYKLDLLDSIFYDEIHQSCIFQRIGDVNQSIFWEWIDNNWDGRILRENPKTILWSNRLHQKTTNIVNQFMSDSWPNMLINANLCLDEEPIINKDISTLTPHLILYEESQKELVIDWFIKLILLKNIHQQDNIYKAIARTTKKKDWLCMESYFPWFRKELSNCSIRNKRYQKTLLWYLMNYQKDESSLANIRKNILSSFVHILKYNIEGINSISDLREDLKNNRYSEEERTNFINNVYIWSKNILLSSRDTSIIISIKEEIKTYIENVLLPSYSLSTQVIDNTYFYNNVSEVPMTNETNEFTSHIERNWIKVEIDSIHWIKWEDHHATLVVMTQYYKNDFEYFKSIYGLIDPLGRNPQAKKMFYVAFSRPKYLLCYAIDSSTITPEQELVLSQNRKIVKLNELLLN